MKEKCTFSAWFCASVDEEYPVSDKVAGDVEELLHLLRHDADSTRLKWRRGLRMT